MLRLALIPFVLGLSAASVSAQEGPGFRYTDSLFDRPGLTAALSGQAMEFFDGSTARYSEDGGYSYTYRAGDPPFVGGWIAGAGGEVCVTFDNGRARCDTYVRNSGRLVLIVANGDRYPVRKVSGLE